mgnify:CR=1 FL=1
MPELQDYVWLRQQWRRFRHILAGALSAVPILCASGLLLLLEDEENPRAWVYARLTLLVMLIASTGVALWLWYQASREIRDLSQRVGEARLEAARARQEKDKKKGRRRA